MNRGRISEYVAKYPNAKYFDGARPWEVCDIALPCATQNELNEDEAKALVANGCIVLLKKLTCLPRQKLVFQNAKLLFAPGKHLMLVE
jgi:glutamate dehydrogenase (NADP+)